MKTKEQIVAMAQKILAKPKDHILFDTETTGLGNKAQIVSISAIDCTGAVLMNKLVKPTVPIDPQASEVTGIYMKDLVDAPPFKDLIEEWESIIAGKKVGAYNIAFDARLLTQTYAAYGLERHSFKGFCVMGMNTTYCGFRKKLGGDHTAIGDCIATLDLIRLFARHEQGHNDAHDVKGLDEILDALGLAPTLPFP